MGRRRQCIIQNIVILRVHIQHIYPTGQNDSLELMFAKFATAKNRKKLNPLKVSSNRCYLPENNNEDV